jgi:lysophospholipase L1-like esterase
MKRYVALGSSMAAGPGIRPRAADAPRWSGRSARNYAHLVAERLTLEPGVDFVDVTFSGATTAHVLTDHQHGRPPQITALDGTEGLVTVTIGGNDVGYVPLLMAASLPRAARRLPLLGGPISELLDRDTRDRALAAVVDSLCAVGHALRRRAPGARIFFVDYSPASGWGVPPSGGVTRDDPAAGRCPRAAASRSGSRPGPAGGRDTRTTHGRRGGGDGMRGRAGCRYPGGRPRCTPTVPGCARSRI